MSSVTKSYVRYVVLVALFSLGRSASVYSTTMTSTSRNRSPSDTTEDNRFVSRYVDENGVKVEKQTVEAVVIQSGRENSTQREFSGRANDWDGHNQDNYQESYDEYATNSEGDSDDDAKQEDTEEDDNSGDNSHSEDKEDNEKQESGTGTSISNALDIFTALHSAWRVVQQKREEIAQKQQANNTQPILDDRSRRNPQSDEDTMNPEKLQPLTPQTPLAEEEKKKPQTDMVEGRYIKGDPLKGYYDFVITEGSYKFWACFQLATAALVIYSTFAAIYYSKVNPIVGDYDYVDYLGGGRSLSDTNVDYQDPISDDGDVKSTSDGGTVKKSDLPEGPTMWSSVVSGKWIPKVGNTAKLILDAVDRISH